MTPKAIVPVVPSCSKVNEELNACFLCTRHPIAFYDHRLRTVPRRAHGPHRAGRQKELKRQRWYRGDLGKQGYSQVGIPVKDPELG